MEHIYKDWRVKEPVVHEAGDCLVVGIDNLFIIGKCVYVRKKSNEIQVCVFHLFDQKAYIVHRIPSENDGGITLLIASRAWKKLCVEAAVESSKTLDRMCRLWVTPWLKGKSGWDNVWMLGRAIPVSVNEDKYISPDDTSVGIYEPEYDDDTDEVDYNRTVCLVSSGLLTKDEAVKYCQIRAWQMIWPQVDMAHAHLCAILSAAFEGGVLPKHPADREAVLHKPKFTAIQARSALFNFIGVGVKSKMKEIKSNGTIKGIC